MEELNKLLFNKKVMYTKNRKDNKDSKDSKDYGDNNNEILELLQGRLALGKERYGHGIRVDEDTRNFGTTENDWELMALEEMLDGLIYTTASIIRYRNKKNKN